MQKIIEVYELTKKYGEFLAVKNLSMEVKAGEVFGFLGPNGAGKTTSIRMLCGLLKPTRGRGQVLGFDIIKENRRIVRQIGYMSQKFGLYDDLTVLENLEFSCKLYSMKGDMFKKRVAEIISRLNMEPFKNQIAANLPYGWRRWLALGCAIIYKPSLIFLDEPTSGMDPLARKEFWAFLYRLAGEGATILISTHYLDEAEHCHKICFIDQGKVVVTGTPRDLKENTIPYFLYRLKVDRLYRALRELKSACYVREVVMHGKNIHVFTEKTEEAEEAIRRHLQEKGVEVWTSLRVTPSLDDVFVYLSNGKTGSSIEEVREIDRKN